MYFVSISYIVCVSCFILLFSYCIFICFIFLCLCCFFFLLFFFFVFFFFFQAEDGIRDDLVTGVQTCALPILFFFGRICGRAVKALDSGSSQLCWRGFDSHRMYFFVTRVRGVSSVVEQSVRSEERRVGKDCRFRWSVYD